MKIIFVALCAATLTGCVAPPMYQWGGYDALLYQSYKNPNKTVNLRLGLETHIALMEQSQQKVAPGLHAELGTLYLQAGSSAQAVQQYTKERNAWPESKGLMDALIATANNRASRKAGAQQ